MKADECTAQEAAIKLVVAMYSYTADPKAPGGFAELSLKQGRLVGALCIASPCVKWVL